MTVTWFQLEVIGIDEAQFFEDLYDFCTEVADHDGKIVIVAGLDGDYLRYYFHLVSVLSNVLIIDTFFCETDILLILPKISYVLNVILYCKNSCNDLYWIIFWILQKELWFSP